jgi:hypothetical protein
MLLLPFSFSRPGIYMATSNSRVLAFLRAMTWLNAKNNLLLGKY